MEGVEEEEEGEACFSEEGILIVFDGRANEWEMQSLVSFFFSKEVGRITSDS